MARRLNRKQKVTVGALVGLVLAGLVWDRWVVRARRLQRCAVLAEQCKTHDHHRDPVSLNFHDRGLVCPCDALKKLECPN